MAEHDEAEVRDAVYPISRILRTYARLAKIATDRMIEIRSTREYAAGSSGNP